MGLQDCQIFLDNPYNLYYAGQTVNGQVKLILNSPKKIRGKMDFFLLNIDKSKCYLASIHEM